MGWVQPYVFSVIEQGRWERDGRLRNLRVRREARPENKPRHTLNRYVQPVAPESIPFHRMRVVVSEECRKFEDAGCGDARSPSARVVAGPVGPVGGGGLVRGGSLVPRRAGPRRAGDQARPIERGAGPPGPAGEAGVRRVRGGVLAGRLRRGRGRGGVGAVGMGPDPVGDAALCQRDAAPGAAGDRSGAAGGGRGGAGALAGAFPHGSPAFAMRENQLQQDLPVHGAVRRPATSGPR